MKKQRNVLISYLLYYGGFLLLIISLILILIYTKVFENYVVDFINLLLVILAIIGSILPLFASGFNLIFYYGYNPNYKLAKALRVDHDKGFIQGVPNNKFEEYKIINRIDDGIITLEYKNGVFVGNYKEELVTIDMNGWIFKKKYIFELLHTSLRINYVNRRKLSLKYTYKTIIDSNIKSLVLIIKIGKKQKKYFISYDGMIKSPIGLRYKNYTKTKFIVRRKKISIKDFYNLNI